MLSRAARVSVRAELPGARRGSGCTTWTKARATRRLLLHGEPTWSFPFTARPSRRSPGRPSGRARLLRLRPLGQAGRARLVHVRPSLRGDRALRRRARPAELTVVVHDWGGPIGLRLAAERPERVARLVITNPALRGAGTPLGRVASLPGLHPPGEDGAAAGSARAQITCVTSSPTRSSPATTRRIRFPKRRPRWSCFPSSSPPSRSTHRRRRCSGSARLSATGASRRSCSSATRSDLLATGRRALLGADPRCGARRAARGRGALPPGGQRRGAGRADRG